MERSSLPQTVQTVYVEHCVNCEQHQETTRHLVEFTCMRQGCSFATTKAHEWDVHSTRHGLVHEKEIVPMVTTKYDRVFQKLKGALTTGNSKIEVVANAHGKPRIGSFEVFSVGMNSKKRIFFSKLRKKTWPRIPSLSTHIRNGLRQQRMDYLESGIQRFDRQLPRLKELFFESSQSNKLQKKWNGNQLLSRLELREDLSQVHLALSTSLASPATFSWEDVLLLLLGSDNGLPKKQKTCIEAPMAKEQMSQMTESSCRVNDVGVETSMHIEASEAVDDEASTPSLRSLGIDYEVRPSIDTDVQADMPQTDASEEMGYEEVPSESEASYSSPSAAASKEEYSDDFD